MEIKILGTAKDLRTQTPVIYAQCDIPNYLALVGEDFASFSIQRKREKFTAYTRLKADIINGTLLPTITLALPIEKSELASEAVKTDNLGEIKKMVQESAPLNILDGLQRTFILKEILESGHNFPPEQLIHLEIRAEPDLDHLIYRIIVLNAGQKPMSMRHQIEILSLSLRKTLIKEIDRLELVPEVDGGRRTRARRYSLDKVSSGYHAYLLKSPEVDKQNVVAQRLSEQAVLQQDVEQFGIQFSEFVEFFRLYCELDDAVEGTIPAGDTLSATNWLGNENTLNAFFAAVADFGSTPARKERIKKALGTLTRSIEVSRSEETLGLDLFQQIIAGFPSRKTNIGYATRKLIFVALKEFFRDEGETPLRDIWEREAE
ncbi:hypothetical protein LOY34_18245 [Pseudomonas sp. B21-009]|uniref:hypothetical protein n=1 Tax=Pseudomonas sp. B21-009 TaxID=2895470 RepID=UPI00215F50B8|nr:hypothetical protein [Pseudomonas sp. B21-009]UVM65265.1 hypothetical protein LOY34_18245 [Pseudomonas sp. B21-009]